MRQRGPQGGPVRLRQLQPEGARQRSAVHAPQGPSASGVGGLCRRWLGLALLDARSLSGQCAEIEQLGAANPAAADDCDIGEHRRMERENALDANTVRDLPNREAGRNASAAAGDADALESLNALLVTLFDPDVHAYRIAGPEGGNIGTEPLFLGFTKGVHGIFSAFSGTVSKHSRERPVVEGGIV